MFASRKLFQTAAQLAKKKQTDLFFTMVRSPLGFEYLQAHDRHSTNTQYYSCHMVNEMSLQKKKTNGITIIFQNIYDGESSTINSTGAQFRLSVYF